MRAMEFTGYPGYLSFRSAVDPACEPPDALVEYGLLRHRPNCALPLSWFAEPDGRYTFFAEIEGTEKLAETLTQTKGKPEDGYQLLGQIITAADDALDHLLVVENRFLDPELIFSWTDPQTGTSSIRLICLPFALAFPPAGEHMILIDAMMEAFSWEDEMADLFQTLLNQQDYGRLLEELPSSPDTGSQSRQVKKMQVRPELPRQARPSFLQKISQALFRPDARDLIHETTSELDLSSGNYKIAQLSEGLPGTPEEEYGQRAYILTEEFYIGRDLKEADLRIDSSAISRLHARIVLKGGSFFIEDLSSRNGTSIDGLQLSRHRQYLLADKCRIAFGDHYFYFRCE